MNKSEFGSLFITMPKHTPKYLQLSRQQGETDNHA